MFSIIYPEDPRGLEVLTQRVKQAAAAGIPQLLTLVTPRAGTRRCGASDSRSWLPLRKIMAC